MNLLDKRRRGADLFVYFGTHPCTLMPFTTQMSNHCDSLSDRQSAWRRSAALLSFLSYTQTLLKRA
eukprot:scaffold867_cov196-Alexandrium_tamarense.AAC.8